MLTKRDLELIEFINLHGGITIEQATKLFFNKAKYGKDLARKRLKKLADNKVLKYDVDFTTNKRIYYKDKKPSSHKLVLLNFYAELRFLGAAIMDFDIEYKIENICRPDALVIFQYKNNARMFLLEVDMSHKTNLEKYQQLYNSNIFQNEYGTFPPIIIMTKHSKDNYNLKKYPFKIFFTDYKISNLKEIL